MALNLSAKTRAALAARLPTGYNVDDLRWITTTAQVLPNDDLDAQDQHVLAELAQDGPPLINSDGKPSIAKLAMWMCHAGYPNQNGDMFVAEELKAIVPDLFREPNFGVMDWNHSAVLGFNDDPVLMGVWYKADWAFDPQACDGVGAWGVLVTGMMFSWLFPEQANSLMIEQQRTGTIKGSMACIPSSRTVTTSADGRQVEILHNPVFFTNTLLDKPPADKDAVGCISEDPATTTDALTPMHSTMPMSETMLDMQDTLDGPMKQKKIKKLLHTPLKPVMDSPMDSYGKPEDAPMDSYGIADQPSDQVPVFAEAIMNDVVIAFEHNSTVVKDEPTWGSVDKGSLPHAAFARKGDPAKKSTWGFPHHWVKDGGNKDDNGCFTTGSMYLHRGGLASAWAAAHGGRSGKEAEPAVVSHLRAHYSALHITPAELQELSDALAKAELMRPLNIEELDLALTTAGFDIEHCDCCSTPADHAAATIADLLTQLTELKKELDKTAPRVEPMASENTTNAELMANPGPGPAKTPMTYTVTVTPPTSLGPTPVELIPPRDNPDQDEVANTPPGIVTVDLQKNEPEPMEKGQDIENNTLNKTDAVGGLSTVQDLVVRKLTMAEHIEALETTVAELVTSREALKAELAGAKDELKAKDTIIGELRSVIAKYELQASEAAKAERLAARIAALPDAYRAAHAKRDAEVRAKIECKWASMDDEAWALHAEELFSAGPSMKVGMVEKSQNEGLLPLEGAESMRQKLASLLKR